MVFVKIVLNSISRNIISSKWLIIKVNYCQNCVYSNVNLGNFLHNSPKFKLVEFKMDGIHTI
jgi:hypothetical protein